MRSPIRAFAHALTDEDYKVIFDLYPASDFQQDVINYVARKEASDPDAPVHFFRVSRILRDLLFTCSSIDFGFEMTRQSKAIDSDFSGVRLYDLNQSMLGPMLQGAGMPYIGTCHGSDTNYIFNGVFPEGHVSEADQELARSISSSFIHFAYTGIPANLDDKAFKSWPESFPDPKGAKERDASGPGTMHLYLIGGPLGTGSCLLGENTQSTNFTEEKDLGSIQIPLADESMFGEMQSAVFQARAKELEREKLLERCAFINTLSEKLGN
jgi:hypothetical protein